jgi:hypothetical protein
MSDYSSASPEQQLWQAVLLNAFMDATRGNPSQTPDRHGMNSADGWIRGGGKDFRIVCALAGMDPDFLRQAYVSGRVCPLRLRRGDRLHRAVRA